VRVSLTVVFVVSGVAAPAMWAVGGPRLTGLRGSGVGLGTGAIAGSGGATGETGVGVGVGTTGTRRSTVAEPGGSVTLVRTAPSRSAKPGPTSATRVGAPFGLTTTTPSAKSRRQRLFHQPRAPAGAPRRTS
jgi:hypothetical protein